MNGWLPSSVLSLVATQLPLTVHSIGKHFAQGGGTPEPWNLPHSCWSW